MEEKKIQNPTPKIQRKFKIQASIEDLEPEFSKFEFEVSLNLEAC